MPFARPTLSALRAGVAADIASGLSGADSVLRYSNLGIMGDALAGMINGLYGYLDWIAKESVPFTADAEFLEAWAAFKGVIRKPSTPASGGSVVFSGSAGTVPAGTALTRSDGATFLTTTDATIAGATAATSAVAAVPGVAGNTAAGSSLMLAIGIAGISPTATVFEPISGGADLESDTDFRTRMLKVYASPPQGGARDDYVEWALEAPGVTRAWVTPNGQGAGTVVVYFMMDVVEAPSGGFPQGTNGVAGDETRDTAATGDQLVVADTIFPLRPVTALVYAVAPGRNALQFTIAGLAAASVTTKGLVAGAIRAALLVNAAPGGVAQLSTIEAAIAAIPAAAGFVITAIAASSGTVTPGAAGNITSNAGYLPALDEITWA